MKRAVSYVKGSVLELKKVSWIKRPELWKSFRAVMVFTILLGLFFAGLDYVLNLFM